MFTATIAKDVHCQTRGVRKSWEPNNSPPHFGDKKNGGRPRLCQRSGSIADEKPQLVGGPRNKRATPNARREFEELAQAWLRLADRAEHEPAWRALFTGSKKTDTE